MRFFDKKAVADIRSQSLSAERNGKLSAALLSYIYEQRLFKLLVPEELYGAALSLPKSLIIFEESAYVDGSFGWSVTIGAGGGYFAPIFSPHVAQEMFGSAEAVVAGSGHLTGIAEPVAGGYRVSGSWRYCSGADYATIFTANSVLPDGSIRSFIFSPEQVQIAQDWDAYGLKATGSHTISVSQVYVPEDRTFDIAGGARHYTDSSYQYPFIQMAEASFAAVSAGIARHFLEEAHTIIAPHSTAGSSVRFNFVHKLIIEQQALLTSAREHCYETMERSWESLLHEPQIPDHLLSAVSQASKQLSKTALRSAQAVYSYLGLSVTQESTPINRCWRDLHTASQHILLKSFE